MCGYDWALVVLLHVTSSVVNAFVCWASWLETGENQSTVESFVVKWIVELRVWNPVNYYFQNARVDNPKETCAIPHFDQRKGGSQLPHCTASTHGTMNAVQRGTMFDSLDSNLHHAEVRRNHSAVSMEIELRRARDEDSVAQFATWACPLLVNCDTSGSLVIFRAGWKIRCRCRWVAKCFLMFFRALRILCCFCSMGLHLQFFNESFLGGFLSSLGAPCWRTLQNANSFFWSKVHLGMSQSLPWFQSIGEMPQHNKAEPLEPYGLSIYCESRSLFPFRDR